MKARMKKAALVAVTIFVLIQFIQPARNESGQVLDTDISKIVALPESVQGILARSCFDCHSNNTHYPWYTYIQPGGWFMAYHIRNGKDKLNFSEFGAYSKRRQDSKLESIGKQMGYFCTFRDSAIRRRAASISRIVTFTMSPTATTSDGSRMNRSASCEM